MIEESIPMQPVLESDTRRGASRGPIPYSKSSIPKALREQVWYTHAGRVYDRKCFIPWCQNIMTVFDFHVGHDVPESRGGVTEIDNLRPICSRCNLSMGATYTIQEWTQLSRPVSPKWSRWSRLSRWIKCIV